MRLASFLLQAAGAARALGYRSLRASVALFVFACSGSGDSIGAPGDDEAVASVRITSATIVLDVGRTATATATAADANGKPVNPKAVTWTSTAPEIAAVSSQSGLDATVVGIAPGEARLTVVADGKTADAIVRVSRAPVGSVSVSPATPTVNVGSTVQLVAVVKDAAGNVVPDRAVNWSSANTSIATVSQTGLVTGVAAGGPIAITVSSEGQSTAASVRVTAAPVALTSVSAGTSHACAIASNGAAYCWGDGSYGRLGNGTNSVIFQKTPGAVQGSLRFETVSAGNGHTCAVALDGRGYCWGRNDYGQLGNGSTAFSNVPVTVSNDLRFSSISAAERNSCGLTTDGAAYCWGWNWWGQLGNGTQSNSNGFSDVPVAVTGGLKFISLSTLAATVCGVTEDGALYCWGYNSDGMLGDRTREFSTVPVRVGTGVQFAVVSVGVRHACGISREGSAYCWGLNENGRLGNGRNFGTEPTPVAVSGNIVFTNISAGLTHTCGRGSDGRAYCWGYNGYGQLGDGTRTDRFVPTPVTGPLMVTTAGVSAGTQFSCGAAVDRILCWGWNSSYRLGNGTYDDSLIPVPVSPPQ
jgi:alpha-tubulin suppressor-like RCC1 family protein